jgi:HPt (histidine-containing phosphotransfer) domain-containing protein
MASDREACLAAGMNDHVGKPFDLDHLVSVLREHAGRQDLAAPAELREPAALPGAVRDAAAAAGLQIEAAMARLGGKPDVYARLLGRFLDDLADLPGQLQGHVAQGDTAAMARLLHTVKGVAATLGASGLAAEAARGEKQLAAPSAPADAGQALASVCAAIEASAPGLRVVLLALQQTLRTDPLAPTAASAGVDPADHAALRQSLRHLAELLRHSDMDAIEAMASLQRQFAGALGARLQALDESIAGLEFEPALRHCDQLIEVLDR